MATLRGLIRAAARSRASAGSGRATTRPRRPGEQVVFDLSQARVTSEFTHIESC
jgi:hypothetical protein